MEKVKLKFILITIVFYFVITSCSVNQEINLKFDGSADAKIEVTIQKVFMDYLFALAEIAGEDSLPAGVLFDVQEVEKAITTRPGLNVNSIENPKPEILKLDLSLEDVEKVFDTNSTDSEKTPATTESAEKTIVKPIISLTGTNQRTLNIHLDSSNYHQLTTLFPVLDNPLIASMGPQPNSIISESEYLEMMVFLLGENGPKAIKESEVNLTIKIEGSIVSHSDGELISSDSLLFEIPLLSILVLNDPINYEIVFEK